METGPEHCIYRCFVTLLTNTKRVLFLEVYASKWIERLDILHVHIFVNQI